jgi:mannose-6-phosphate isomerase-like protein (cupin superfamily)
MATVAAALLVGCGCADREAAGVLTRSTEVLDPATIERFLVSHPKGAGGEQQTRLLESREFSADLLQIDSQPRRLHREHDVTLFVYRGVGDVVINDLRRRARPGDLFHIPRSTPYSIASRGDGPLILVEFFTPPMEQADTVELPPGEQSYERGD